MVVVPAPTPVTTPDVLIVATLVVAELLQTPPAVISAKGIVEPTQTADAPLMTATVGMALIVMTLVDVPTQLLTVTE